MRWQTSGSFPVAEHRRHLTGTKLYCLVTEARGCKQLAQSCYLIVNRPGVKIAIFLSWMRCPNHWAIKPRTNMWRETSKKGEFSKYHIWQKRYSFLEQELTSYIIHTHAMVIEWVTSRLHISRWYLLRSYLALFLEIWQRKWRKSPHFPTPPLFHAKFKGVPLLKLLTLGM